MKIIRKVRTSFFLLALVFIFSNCESLKVLIQEPKVSIKTVDIAGITMAGVDLIAHVEIENPNAISIPFPRVDWEIFINTASFIKGTVPNKQPLSAHEKVILDLPVSLTYEGLFRSFAALADAKETAYKIALGLGFTLPVLGEKTFHLDFSGLIPILQMPVMAFQNITARSAGSLLNPVFEFVLNWEIDNKNNFALNIGEFVYDFRVNNRQLAQSRMNNPPRINANGKTVIPLTISIGAGAVATELLSIVSRGGSVEFSCTGNMSLLGDIPGLRLDLPFSRSGSTQIR